MSHDDCDFHDIDSRAGDEVFELRDEIETLTADRDRWKAEAARLRAALSAITNQCRCAEVCSCSEDMAATASAALALAVPK